MARNLTIAFDLPPLAFIAAKGVSMSHGRQTISLKEAGIKAAPGDGDITVPLRSGVR